MIALRSNNAPFADNTQLGQTPVIEVFQAPVLGVIGGRTLIEASRGLRLLEKGRSPLVFLPPSSVALRFLRPSDTMRIDDYGLAVHLHLACGGQVARDVLWYYPGPDPELAAIAGMICVNPARFDSLTVAGIRVMPGDQPGSWRMAQNMPQQGAA